MAAPKGNKYAYRVTLEEAIKIAEDAYNRVDDDCYFLSHVADEIGTYRQKFEYVVNKYNDNPKVFNTIKKLYNKCESIVMRKTAEKEIVPSLGIFVLKAYHGLMETTHNVNENDNKHSGKIEIVRTIKDGNKP